MPFYLSLHSSYFCSSTILSYIIHWPTIRYLSIFYLSTRLLLYLFLHLCILFNKDLEWPRIS